MIARRGRQVSDMQVASGRAPTATIDSAGLNGLDGFLDPPRRGRTDAASLVAVFVVAQLIIPARLVISGLPLSLSPASVLALSAAFLWFFSQFTVTLGAAKGPNGARTGLFIFATALLMSYALSMAGYLPADEVNNSDHAILLSFGMIGLALCVCDGVRGRDRLDMVLRTIVVCGAIISVIGMLQFMVNIDLTAYMRIPGLHYTSQDGFITDRSNMRRVAATTGHPIEFGVVCAMLVPLAVHYAFKAQQSRIPSGRWWCCVALIGCGLMFSISRSAILGMAGAGLVLFIGWSARRRLQALGVVVAFLAVIKVVSPGLLGTIFGLFSNAGSDTSVTYRTHDYPVAAEEFLRHVWFGRGPGTWFAPKHQVFDNQYLTSLVELGIIGLLAFIGVMLAGMYAALRVRFLSSRADDRDLGLTLAAMLVVPLLGCLTFDLGAFATATGLMFLIVGAAGSLLRTVRADNPLPGSMLPSR